mgnify:CR=1 FL=1
MDFLLIVSGVLVANALTFAAVYAVKDLSRPTADRPIASLLSVIAAAGVAIYGAFVFLDPQEFSEPQRTPPQYTTEDPLGLRDIPIFESQ